MDWLSGGENKPEPKPLKKPSGRNLELELTDTGTHETKLGDAEDELALHDENVSQEEMLTDGRSGTMDGSTRNTAVLYKIEPNKFAFQQSKIYLFVKDDIHWSFTCFLAWIFFLSFGVPPLTEYGYDDWTGEDPHSETDWSKSGDSPKLNTCKEAVTASQNRWQIFTCDPDAENIVSGPSGSGVAVISAMLAAVGSAIFITRFLQYDAAAAHPEFKVLDYKYAVDKIYESCAKRPQGTAAQGY